MHIAARKRRYRRISHGGAVNPPGATAPIVFDRLESLQQKIHAEQLHEPLDVVLVTSDNYLSLALTQYLFKHQHTHVCALLEEAEALFEQNPSTRVLIDLDCINEPIIGMLDTTRQWQKTCPCLSITLLTACRCAQTANLIRAASSFPVIERRQGVTELFNSLVQKQKLPTLISPAHSSNPGPLSNREWKILLEMAKGDSLKTIASSLKKPYHYVVYTIGKVSARIGLGNNKALIHLLNKLSQADSEKQ